MTFMEKTNYLYKLADAVVNNEEVKIPGNGSIYSLANAPVNSCSHLAGKKVFFLGSSITYGAGSYGESFVDYLAKEDGLLVQKEAISGTTLGNIKTEIPRFFAGKKDKLSTFFVNAKDMGKLGLSYIARLKYFNKEAHPDAFVCQLSTNDSRKGVKLGEISDSRDAKDFDTTTTIGAIEYICAYVKQTWHCPLAFYTCLRSDDEYSELIDILYDLRNKWGFTIFDLGRNDRVINETRRHSNYMVDDAHPTRAGYEMLWTPYFRGALSKLVKA